MKHSLTSSSSSQFKGQITVPGDKSISHRALIFASQNIGRTFISGLLESEDVIHTAEALKAMGTTISRISPGEWIVNGVGVGGLRESDSILYMGNSGTSTRLLAGLMSTYPFTSFFTGDASLNKRPMKRIITPLEQMGATFLTHEGNRLPMAVTGTATPLPISYTLPVASAQVKTAILLAGLNCAGITTVIEPERSRDHTELMLPHFGAKLEIDEISAQGRVIRLHGQPSLHNPEIAVDVSADPSSAAFLTVAALISPQAEVTIRNVCVNPLRTGIYDTLREMGGDIEFKNTHNSAGEEVADIVVRSSKLTGITVPADRAPSMIDEYPILAVAAACATGTSKMLGLRELRVKESDRLAAIATGLQACGANVEAGDDTLTVHGKGEPPRGEAMITCHMDHRIAMSFLVLGMVSKLPISVDDARCIQTSFPGFVRLMNRLGAKIAPTQKQKTLTQGLVVAVDGPAASGKGTLARRLAEHLGSNYLDTGRLYRAVGLRLVYAGKDPHDKAAAIEAARTITANDLANPRLRQEHVGEAASIVSAYPEVREILLHYQRNFAKQRGGAVLDGRDIGTVVCPQADIKLFITATLDARARRRHKELQGQGIEVVYESVLDDLKSRDRRDSGRESAPLRPAEDAIELDTSDLNINEVFEKVLSYLPE